MLGFVLDLFTLSVFYRPRSYNFSEPISLFSLSLPIHYASKIILVLISILTEHIRWFILKVVVIQFVILLAVILFVVIAFRAIIQGINLVLDIMLYLIISLVSLGQVFLVPAVVNLYDHYPLSI